VARKRKRVTNDDEDALFRSLRQTIKEKTFYAARSHFLSAIQTSPSSSTSSSSSSSSSLVLPKQCSCAAASSEFETCTHCASVTTCKECWVGNEKWKRRLVYQQEVDSEHISFPWHAIELLQICNKCFMAYDYSSRYSSPSAYLMFASELREAVSAPGPDSSYFDEHPIPPFVFGMCYHDLIDENRGWRKPDHALFKLCLDGSIAFYQKCLPRRSDDSDVDVGWENGAEEDNPQPEFLAIEDSFTGREFSYTGSTKPLSEDVKLRERRIDEHVKESTEAVLRWRVWQTELRTGIEKIISEFVQIKVLLPFVMDYLGFTAEEKKLFVACLLMRTSNRTDNVAPCWPLFQSLLLKK
jgi:hypothetical protein